MTLKTFLSNKTLTSVEITEAYGLIYNVFVDDASTPNGLNIDCSNVPAGTILSKRTDFNLSGDILSVGSISINTNDVNMLASEPPF